MKFFVRNLNHFDSRVWKNNLDKRKNYLNLILDSSWMTARTKEEVFNLLGEESNYFHLDRWTYFVGYNIFGNKKYLTVYFEEGKVGRITVEKLK